MEALPVVALAFYLLSVLLSLHELVSSRVIARVHVRASAIIAIILHFLWLNEVVFIESGQNLSVLNGAAIISLLMVVLMSALAGRLNVRLVLPLTYLFAICTILAASMTSKMEIIHLGEAPLLLLHVLLNFFAYAVLAVAFLFSLQLGYLDWRLKKRKFRSSEVRLPPLMTVERQLFLIISSGFFLLTLALISGVFLLQEELSWQMSQELGSAVLAWLCYLMFIWGRHRYGWRGRKTVWCNLIGFVLLSSAYFGSNFIQSLMFR